MKITRTAALAATAVGLTLAAATTTGATAGNVGGDNAFTWGEFMGTDAGQAQNNVQGQYGCTCHGTTIRHWTGHDGHRRFMVLYPDGDTSSVYLTYRYDGFGYPRVVSRMFATDGDGYTVPFTD